MKDEIYSPSAARTNGERSVLIPANAESSGSASFIVYRCLLVSREGIEPSTDGLKARCSTTELPARSYARSSVRGVWLNKAWVVSISGEDGSQFSVLGSRFSVHNSSRFTGFGCH
jgi:hypothetical protein